MLSEMEAELASPDEEIPVLDVGPFLDGRPGGLQRLAADVRHALADIGFFYVRNHGVAAELIDRVFAENVRFHALSLERKLQVQVNTLGVGYMPMQGIQIKSFEGRKDNKPDMVEGFVATRERAPHERGPEWEKAVYRCANRWPPDLPGFRETVIEYYAALESLAVRLLPVYATALEMPPDFFDDAFRDGRATGVLRLSHYPSIAIEENQFSVAPHVDGDFITFLAQSEVPGLHIRTKSGKWIQAPVLPATLLVNSGEMLRVWSNDCLIATPHRVINSGACERYAIPFFYFPHPDTLMKCLPTCQGPDRLPRYGPITVGAYSEWFAKENFQYPHGQ